MNILITGASGFIGNALVDKLSSTSSYNILGTTRNLDKVYHDNKNINYVLLEEISANTDWSNLLKEIDVVVHLAARAHILKKDPQAIRQFQAINIDGAVNLARQALEAGVRRFVFISSIGVNGSYTNKYPFNELSEPAPDAAYSISKYHAEKAITNLLNKKSNMELVIIRPPLVYAANAPGNFRRLIKLVNLGIPLPFGMVKNRRSIVALENLIDFIVVCINHPAAANQVFLISDKDDVSTTDIVHYLAKGMGKKIILLPIPMILLKVFARLIGKSALYFQLCESLTIDCQKASTLLNWRPVIKSREALQKAGTAIN